MENTAKILIHTCCGICSGQSIQELKDMGFEPVAYFYNPNIDTEDEYNRRLEAQKTVCKYHNIKLVAEEYHPEEYLEVVQGLENEPEGGKRCTECFKLRLEQSAKKSEELQILSFTTSMPISPHKNFKLISSIGEKIADRINDLKYYAIDFKKKDGFLKTNKLSKDLGLYRQNYCGCRFAK